MDLIVAGLALLAIVARAVYPRVLEQRGARRHPIAANGIIVGAEEINLERPGAPALLLVHGGGDSPQSMSELARHLHGHGFAVRVPLLRNHGRALSAVRRFDAAEWMEQVRREMDALAAHHDWVGVVGLSAGGALGLRLAAECSSVKALVLLAPYVAAAPGVRALARTSQLWGAAFPYLPSLSGRSIHDRAAAAQGFGAGITTPAALRAFASLAELADDALPAVTAPTLVIQSREDNRLSPLAAERAFAKLGASDKRFVWTEGAGHVISVDFGKDHVFAQTSDWMRRHARL